jgi:hypothetical protein
MVLVKLVPVELIMLAAMQGRYSNLCFHQAFFFAQYSA